jgi:uncharacterized protein (DUF736 family)
MAIIGKFDKQGDGSFWGTIWTMALQVTDVHIVPIDTSNRKEGTPDYRVKVLDAEVGAGWKRVSKAGNPYLSLKIDDPILPHALYCALRKSGDNYVLDWTRPDDRKGGRSEEAPPPEL